MSTAQRAAFSVLLCAAVFSFGVADAQIGTGGLSDGPTADDDTPITDANKECPDPDATRGYNSAHDPGATYQDGSVKKINLYGKACVSLDDANKAAEGKCEGPKQCHAILCAGELCKLPSVKIDTAKNSLQQDVSKLTPATDPNALKTPLSQGSIIDRAFLDPTSLSQQKNTISASGQSVEEQIRNASESPGLIGTVKNAWNSYFSPEKLGDSTVQLSETTSAADTAGAKTTLETNGVVSETTFSGGNSASASQTAECGWWCTTRETLSSGVEKTKELAYSAWDAVTPGSAIAKPSNDVVQKITQGEPVTGDASVYDPTQPGGYKSGGKGLATGGTYDARSFEAALQLDLAKASGCGYGVGNTCFAQVDYRGKSLIVEINDNGPLVDNRVIDLNRASMDYFTGGGNAVLKDVKVTLLEGSDHTPGQVSTSVNNPQPPEENPRIAESAYGPVWQPDVSASIYGSGVRPVESGTLPDITPDYAALVPSDIFNNSNSEFFAADRDALDSRNIPDEVITSQLPPLEAIDDGERITAEINEEFQRQDRFAQADAENPETPATFNERFAPTEQLPISTADIDTKTEAELQADVAANKELMKELADSRQPPASIADDRPWWQRFLSPEPSSVERAAAPVVAVESSPLPDITPDYASLIPQIEPAEVDLGMTASESAVPTGVVTSEPLPDVTPSAFAERVPDSVWNAQVTETEPPASFDERFAAAPAVVPENSETRQTFSPEAITLQEQALQKNLEDQTRLLQETSGTLSDDAVARGIAACESAPSGRLCRSYQTYNVAVQTEQLKYDAIVANYESFVAYKNGGSLNANLTRSLAEIEKGQGSVSAAIDSYAQPYREAAKEWFAPIAESYKEGDWTTLAKESWKSVPALGNMVWGGLSTDVKIVGERLPLDSLGFSPLPEEAARCGAVGQALCDAEGAVSAGNVVGAVWGTGVIAKGVGSVGSEFVRQVGRTFDDVAETAVRQVDEVSGSLSVQPAPVPSLLDDAVRAAPDTPRALETPLAPDLPMQRVGGDITSELNTSVGRTVREQVDDDIAFIREANETPTLPRVEEGSLAPRIADAPQEPVVSAPRESLVTTVREMDAAQRKLDDALQEFQLSRTVANDPTPLLASREAALKRIEDVIADVKKFETPETNLGTAELQRGINDIRGGTPDAELSFQSSLQRVQDEIKATILDKRADAGIVDRIQLAYLGSKDSVTDFASSVFGRRTAEPPAGLNDNIIPTQAQAVGESRTTGIGTLAEQDPNLSVIRGSADVPTSPSAARVADLTDAPPLRTEPASPAANIPPAAAAPEYSGISPVVRNWPDDLSVPSRGTVAEISPQTTRIDPSAIPEGRFTYGRTDNPFELSDSAWRPEPKITPRVEPVPEPLPESGASARATPEQQLTIREQNLLAYQQETAERWARAETAIAERRAAELAPEPLPPRPIDEPLGAGAPPIVRNVDIPPATAPQAVDSAAGSTRVPNVGNVLRNGEPSLPQPWATAAAKADAAAPTAGTGAGTAPAGKSTAQSIGTGVLDICGKTNFRAALCTATGVYVAYNAGQYVMNNGVVPLVTSGFEGARSWAFGGAVRQPAPPATTDEAKTPPATTGGKPPVAAPPVAPPAPRACGPNETFASSGCTPPYAPPVYGPAYAPAVYSQNGQILSGDYFCMTSKNPVVIVPLAAGSRWPANCYNSPPGATGSGVNGIFSALMQRAFAPQSSQPQTPQRAPQTAPFVPSVTPSPSNPQEMVVTLIANPGTVEVKRTSLLSWASIGTRTCDVEIPATGETLARDGKPDGSVRTPELDATTVFRVKCRTAGQDIYATSTVQVK